MLMMDRGQAAAASSQPQYVITEADKKRQADIEYARAAFECELEEPLEQMDGATDDNIVDGLEDKIDAAAAFLFGKELEISIEDGIEEAAQELINTTWGKKEKRIPLLAKLAYNGMIGGQAFLRVKPQKDGSFRLVPLDPATTFVKCMPQDCEVPILFCMEYCEEYTNAAGLPDTMYYREEIARIPPVNDDGLAADPDTSDMFYDDGTTWLITHWTRQGERGDWEAVGDPIPWAWPFPPVFSCQNRIRPNSYWGRPEITRNLVKLVEAFNITNSTTQMLGRIGAGSLVWIKGGDTGSVEPRPGHLIELPSPDSEIGAVQLQLDFAGMQGIADRLQSRIDERTAVPGIATGRASAMPGGHLSGIAIELLFMSLIKRNDMKRCNYGGLILDVSRAVLIMAGFSPDIEITLQWQNPLPNDDLASWQAAALAKQSGVSDQTLLEERGYDPLEEAERNKQEDAAKMIAYSRGQGFPPPAVPENQGQPGGIQGANNEQPQGDQAAASDSPFIGRGL